jgi:hypothetical protein
MIVRPATHADSLLGVYRQCISHRRPLISTCLFIGPAQNAALRAVWSLPCRRHRRAAPTASTISSWRARAGSVARSASCRRWVLRWPGCAAVTLSILHRQPQYLLRTMCNVGLEGLASLLQWSPITLIVPSRARLCILHAAAGVAGIRRRHAHQLTPPKQSQATAGLMLAWEGIGSSSPGTARVLRAESGVLGRISLRG